MGWSRRVAALVSGILLSGCVSTGTAFAASGPKLDVEMFGSDWARPGQVVDLSLEWVPRGSKAVTAISSAFSGPVALKWSDDHGGFDAVATLAMSAKPGVYPLVAKIGDRVVARNKIRVLPSQRPSFEVQALYGTAARPGEQIDTQFDDLYPGESGTGFTVRSTALADPVRLVHDNQYDHYTPRLFTGRPYLRPDVKDGTYAFDLYGPDGRRVAEKSLTVRAARPGDSDYLGKARGPVFSPTFDLDTAREHGYRVRAGGRVYVLWKDTYPDPGEENRLSATSPAFTRPVNLRRDDTKAADGDDPRYYAMATVRTGLTPGTYPVTVVAHHGRVKRTGQLIVAGRPVAKRSVTAGPGTGWLGVSGGLLILTALGVYVVRRRRHTTA
ncbi:hypothetical protein ACIQB5_33180 [Streptomyces sp. NPDC088560]|uniref:hypothetical protein n=1 Tax=Streptomyces sp. NPDC088560 TaxID=3365868 RepID=UPI003818BEF4